MSWHTSTRRTSTFRLQWNLTASWWTRYSRRSRQGSNPICPVCRGSAETGTTSGDSGRRVNTGSGSAGLPTVSTRERGQLRTPLPFWMSRCWLETLNTSALDRPLSAMEAPFSPTAPTLTVQSGSGWWSRTWLPARCWRTKSRGPLAAQSGPRTTHRFLHPC